MIDIQSLIQAALAGDPQAIAMIQQMQMPQVLTQEASPLQRVRTQQRTGANLGTDSITQDTSMRNGTSSSDSVKLPASHLPIQQKPTHSFNPGSILGHRDEVTNYLKPKTSGPTVKPVVKFIS